MINTTSERLSSRIFFNCQYFCFYEEFEILCSVEFEHEKSFITLGPGLFCIYIKRLCSKSFIVNLITVAHIQERD